MCRKANTKLKHLQLLLLRPKPSTTKSLLFSCLKAITQLPYCVQFSTGTAGLLATTKQAPFPEQPCPCPPPPSLGLAVLFYIPAHPH